MALQKSRILRWGNSDQALIDPSLITEFSLRQERRAYPIWSRVWNPNSSGVFYDCYRSPEYPANDSYIVSLERGVSLLELLIK